MPGGIRGLVLDVDDTLYLERDYVRSGFKALDTWASATLGVRGLYEEAWMRFERGDRGTTVTDALSALGVDVEPALAQEAIAVYRGHRPQITMLPDARSFLLTAQGRLPLGVVTDGPSESQRQKCEQLGVTDWADPLVISAELGTSKPDPALFDRFGDAWGLPPDALAYVADNPLKDFGGPQQLGWQSFRIRRTGSLHEALPTPHPVVEINDLKDFQLTSRLAT